MGHLELFTVVTASPLLFLHYRASARSPCVILHMLKQIFFSSPQALLFHWTIIIHIVSAVIIGP